MIRFMQKLMTLIITFLLTTIASQAYDIVLPKSKNLITDTQYAFFIGKAKPTESFCINDVKIPLAQNGAFAYSVKLKNGENRIILRSLFKRQIYKIYKEPLAKSTKPELMEFEAKLYRVKNDNTPLRSSPIDAGMNRIAHLFKDTNLLINAEQGDFYRVYLSENKRAWIAKSAVESVTDTNIPQFITMNSETFKNASVHTLEFTDKLPYTIDETNKEIIFKVYNPQASKDSVYTVNVRKPSDKYTYKINLSNGNYRLKVSSLPKNENKTLEGLNIVIDPGHGGDELGAIGCLGNKEKDINLKIALELQDILSQMGANIFMTRECDANISLDERVDFAKNNNANIFVSIHLNSIPDICMNVHKNRGTSVYYYNEHSKILADSVKNSIVKNLKTHDEGIKTASFAVIRPTDYLGILVEVAYMTNPYDSVIYTSDSFPRDTAKAIAEGILNYSN